MHHLQHLLELLVARRILLDDDRSRLPDNSDRGSLLIKQDQTLERRRPSYTTVKIIERVKDERQASTATTDLLCVDGRG